MQPLALRLLFKIGWRYLSRHPWQSILMILGIVLGVAVVVAIDLANASASRAFELSTQAVAGNATHQITGGPGGLRTDLYRVIRRSNLEVSAAPIISGYAISPQLSEIPFEILGIDPFAEAPFRDFLTSQASTAQVDETLPDVAALLTRSGAVLLSAETARRFDLAPCQIDPQRCDLTLIIEGTQHTGHIVGLIQTNDRISRQAVANVLITDLASAQEFFNRYGKIDRIDLILPSGEAAGTASHAISALLPAGVTFEPAAARQGTLEEMTRAFRLNLAALSLLALVVGLFLIYNTMTFSVVQRRKLFGVLRSLGLTRKEVFILVICEAFIVGILGALGGLAIGIPLGQGAVRLVSRTINDLFFVLNVQGVQVPPGSVLKGLLLGIIATVATATPPAWEAASVPPRVALLRSGLEHKASRAVRFAGILSVAMLLVGIILLLSSTTLFASFAGTFTIIIGLALLTPLITTWLMKAAQIPLGRLAGSLGRMAPRNVVNSLSRTAIAVAALMVAISVTIGVSLMVSSFRYTVQAWLEQSLQGDLYISTPGLTATRSSGALDPRVLERLSSWPGLAQVSFLRAVDIEARFGSVQLAATSDPDPASLRIFQELYVPEEDVNLALQTGAVLISEPLSNRPGFHKQNQSIELLTQSGWRSFFVAGIYYDYASTRGTVLMSLDTYRELWLDPTLTAAAIRVSPTHQVDNVLRDLEIALAPLQQLEVRANQTLRAEVLAIFDQTFAITAALQILATIVAFIGIVSALLSVELERQRELGILRALGLTAAQMWRLILVETGLIGVAAGLLAMPTGYILAIILIYIINRRSFGWTLQLNLYPDPFLQALLIAILAAILAGLYPAHRLGKMLAAEALRSE